MNPDSQEPPAPVQPPEPAGPKIDNPLAVMEPGEQVVCEIKRHPIGMFGMYSAAGVLLIVVAILALLAPHIFGSSSRGQVMSIGAVAFVVTAAASAGFLFIAGKVYWGNRWVVTSDSITQIKQISLFDRQTSQLSLGDLEDITAEQDGLLAQVFHFGVISAETAGATDKFTFPYCPNPNSYAKQILAARERFEEQHRQSSEPGAAAPKPAA